MGKKSRERAPLTLSVTRHLLDEKTRWVNKHFHRATADLSNHPGHEAGPEVTDSVLREDRRDTRKQTTLTIIQYISNTVNMENECSDMSIEA